MFINNSDDGNQVSLQFLRPPWTSVFNLYHECHTPTDIQVKPPSFILHLSESPWHNWPSMLVKGWAPQWVWPHPCLLLWTPGFISISEVLLGSWFMILKKYLSTQPKHTQILSPRFSPIYDLERSVDLRLLFDHRCYIHPEMILFRCQWVPLHPPSHKNPKLFRGVCSSFAEGGVSAVKIVNLIWCSEIVKIVNLVCTQNPDESAHSRRDLHFRLYFTLITLIYEG